MIWPMFVRRTATVTISRAARLHGEAGLLQVPVLSRADQQARAVGTARDDEGVRGGVEGEAAGVGLMVGPSQAGSGKRARSKCARRIWARRKQVGGNRREGSAAADGVNDLHAVAGEQRSPLVLAAGNDLRVHLDGDPAPPEVQACVQELQDVAPSRSVVGVPFSINSMASGYGAPPPAVNLDEARGRSLDAQHELVARSSHARLLDDEVGLLAPASGARREDRLADRSWQVLPGRRTGERLRVLEEQPLCPLDLAPRDHLQLQHQRGDRFGGPPAVQRTRCRTGSPAGRSRLRLQQ